MIAETLKENNRWRVTGRMLEGTQKKKLIMRGKIRASRGNKRVIGRRELVEAAPSA